MGDVYHAKKIGLDIRKVELGGICTCIQLFCQTCDVIEQKQSRQMIYLKDKLENNLGAERKQLVRQITSLTSKMNKQKIVSKRQMPLRTTNYIREKMHHKNALQFDVNRRLYTTAFLSGAGYNKTASLLATLNFGNPGHERGFYRHQETVCDYIRDITTNVIKEAMDNEIKATIIDGLLLKEIPDDIALELYLKWKEGDKVTEIFDIGLTISFDMAWQKRGSGNRYDSISGHAIMIGGMTKKVIGIIVYVILALPYNILQCIYSLCHISITI